MKDVKQSKDSYKPSKNTDSFAELRSEIAGSPTTHSLKHHFLVATPRLDAGIFKSSVTYICEHNEEGAMGLIINRPSTMFVEEILAELNNTDEVVSVSANADNADDKWADNQPVMVGGPVGLERGFVLHQTPAEQSNWDSSLRVTNDIALTGSKDILFALREGNGPENYLLALGYAGWEAGQLEQEIREDAWIAVPASLDVLFSTPIHERANAAVAPLGIDLALFSTTSGNA